MDEKELKTSTKQRVFIILIAIIMVGSIIASYIAIVINGSKGSSSSSDTKVDEAKVAEYQKAYEEKVTEFKDATKSDFEKFAKYESEIKAYNESSANDNGVQKRDLSEGSGKTIEGTNYLAYYVGWCADETVFDSSFDDKDNPKAFSKVLDPSLGMIEGWTTGVEGMKLGGIREVTIPGNLAYGDQMEICGGYNKPLKFMIMAVAKEDPLETMATELDEAYMRYMGLIMIR